MLTCFSSNVDAKKLIESDIVGHYGGVIILEDNVFALIGMGTLMRGRWELTGNLVTFTSHKDQLFRLYGRKLSEPEKPNQIRFGGFMRREVSIGLTPAGKRKKSAQNLFKRDSCHKNEMYSYAQEKQFKTIYLAQKEDARPLDYEHTVYEFKIPNKYNDLIAYMPRPMSVNTQVFAARFDNNQLQAEPSDASYSILGNEKLTKDSLETINEFEIKMIRSYAKNGLYPSVLKYKNSHDRNTELSDEFYPIEKNPTSDNTQDYIEIVPTITNEIIKHDKQHLIDVELSLIHI